MKTIKSILLLATFPLLLTSCLSQGVFYRTAKSKDIKPYIVSNPTLVDLIVENEKVSCEFESNYIPGKSTFEFYKSLAIFKATEKAKCDIIVEPQYDITIVGSKANIKIKGFPANYKNFRAYSPADSAVFILQRFNIE